MGITRQEKEIQAQVDLAIKSGQTPTQYIKDSRGYTRTNPAYARYQNYLSTQTKASQAQKNIAESGIKIENPGTLTRTVASFLSGQSNPSSFNPEEERQIKIAQLNQQVRSGDISTAQYQREIESIKSQYQQRTAQRTQDFGKTAAIQGKSEITKQREQRAVAENQGIALGTIQSDKSAASSQNSIVSQSDNVSNFVEAQKQPLKQIEETKPNYAYEVTLGETLGIIDSGEIIKNGYQGPPKPVWSVTTLEKGKLPNGTGSYEGLIPTVRNFTSEKEANEFIKSQNIEQKNKVLMPYHSSNLLQNIVAGQYNALRYADAVDNKELPEPKGIQWLNYYASKWVSPIANIPFQIAGDKNTQPTLSDTIISVPLDLITKGKTETHDPVGDYIKKDPIGALGQLPAEAALWITGSKVVGAGTSAIKKYSPIQYQVEKILTNEGKTKSVIRALTVNDKPVVSIQQGQLTKGFNPLRIPYSEINVSGRYGFEAAKGTGIEKTVYYSPIALSTQSSKGVIPKIAEQRANAWVKAVDQAKGITNKPSSIGASPIQGLTEKQNQDIIAKVIKGQKENKIETLHGSIATKTAIPESIQKQAGSSLLLGDIDVHPIGSNLVKSADDLIRGFAKDFPLEKGQRVKIEGVGKNEETNRALKIIEEGKEEKKILEVVLNKSDEYSKYGIDEGNKILGQNIPFNKSVKIKDYPIKVKSADYQLLTNVKQALAYQKGKDTILDIYPASGRTKDIVRAYWNLKAKAFFKGGEKGKALDTQAEKIRSLYPGVEFTDYQPEKVLLFSSQTTSKSSSSLSKGITQNGLKVPSKESNFDNEIKVSKESSFESSLSKLKGSRNLTESLGSLSRYQAKPLSQYRPPTLSRHQPRPISRDLGSIHQSRYEPRNITSKIYGTSKKDVSNSRIPSTLDIPKSNIDVPRSKIDVPSIFKISPPSRTIITRTPPARPPPTLRPFNRTSSSSLIDNNKTKKILVPLIDWKTRQSEPKERPRKYREDFLGNTRTDSVIGIFGKRKETTYNPKTINKALGTEKNLTRTKNDTNSNKGLIGMNKRSTRSFW